MTELSATAGKAFDYLGNAFAWRLRKPFGWIASLPFRSAFRPRQPVELAPEIAHPHWMDYLETHFNKPGMRVLEIGARNVTWARFRERFSDADYVGFDVLDGPNVDVVGDAHRLTSYFADSEPFDLIFSSAVFEHLYMPWIVAQEIQKLLKVGGHVFVETHFSFSAHERPWNFFQFSDMGLRALFNPALGFDLVAKGMSTPMVGYFARGSAPYLRFDPVTDLFCHSQILCRKRCDVDGFDWTRLEADDLVEGTRYPAPAA